MGKRRYEPPFQPEPILAQSDRQAALIQAITYNTQIISTGSAGTGKTFITAGMAADWYIKSKSRTIVITRPMIPVGEDLGALPGDVDEKTQPWAMPVINVLRQRVGSGKVECDLGRSIRVCPLQLMRGETFDDTWIIADECQNLTIDQARMLVTRTGRNSKLCINGDLDQKDIPSTSGLAWLIEQINRYSLDIPIINFTLEDCQRSDECKMWLKVFQEEDHRANR